jgi:hypothetical protein
MRCNHYRNQFTARFEGELNGEPLAQHEQHIDSCEACESEWDHYQQSVGALSQMGVRNVPDSYVDSILAATIGTGTAVIEDRPQSAVPAPLRLLLSHAAAALAGAALLMLLMRLMPERTAQEQLNVMAPPSAEEFDAQELASLQPMESAPELQPQIEYVDRIVERIQYVPIPLALGVRRVGVPVIQERNSAALQHSLSAASQALGLMGQALQRNSDQQLALLQKTEQDDALRAAQRLELGLEQADVHASDPEPEPEWIPRKLSAESLEEQESALFVAMNEEQVPPLVIQRTDSRVSLQTYGTLHEIVPALIARIDDSDPLVNELVQGQLQEIWTNRMGMEFEHSAMAGTAALDRSGVGWRRWVPQQEEALSSDKLNQQWSDWWANEQLALASAEF